jgi:predicted neutral ceramidase superfamily lipid hydrolase
LIAGILDISSAFALSYPKGVGPIRVLQGVAAGLLGRESAINGGMASAGLGLAIHFFIAFVAASVFYLASRQITWLTQQAVLAGFLYGVAIYGVMYWIVMPLAYPVVHPSLTRDLTAIAVHMFLIGLPIALIVRRYSRPQLSTLPSASAQGLSLSNGNSQPPQ